MDDGVLEPSSRHARLKTRLFGDEKVGTFKIEGGPGLKASDLRKRAVAGKCIGIGGFQWPEKETGRGEVSWNGTFHGRVQEIVWAEARLRLGAGIYKASWR